EEDCFWFCDDGFDVWGGICAGDGSCCCSAAVYGFCGFAGWGGEDDAALAGGGAGGFGRRGYRQTHADGVLAGEGECDEDGCGGGSGWRVYASGDGGGRVCCGAVAE